MSTSPTRMTERPISADVLEFDDKVLVGYDGCYELPDEVIEAVKDLGHEIEEYITIK